MSISPVALKVNGKEWILNSANERRVKERMHQQYTPEQIVEVWVDGNKDNELELQDIFNP